MARALSLAFLIVFFPACYAQTGAGEFIASDESDLSGEGGLGLIVNRGNTNNENFNANLKLSIEQNDWKHSLGIDARKTTEENQITGEDETIARRYLFTAKTDYSYGEHAYLFVAFRYDDDRFSGFHYQTSLTSGVGWHIINQEYTTFDLEVGAGYKESKLRSTGEIEEENIGRFGQHFRRQITETTVFIQDLLVESGNDQTITEFSAGLKVAVNSKFAIKLNHLIKRSSNPPAGRDDTDQTTSINLVYGF